MSRRICPDRKTWLQCSLPCTNACQLSHVFMHLQALDGSHFHVVAMKNGLGMRAVGVKKQTCAQLRWQPMHAPVNRANHCYYLSSSASLGWNFCWSCREVSCAVTSIASCFTSRHTAREYARSDCWSFPELDFCKKSISASSLISFKSSSSGSASSSSSSSCGRVVSYAS